MKYSWREAASLVEARAHGRCEYCGMHQSLQGATFHVEHAYPQSRGGVTELDNLAWCCPSCNLHKSNRTEAEDADSGKMVALFNPREMSWGDHFTWEGYRAIGVTAIGRATVMALQLNHSRRMLIRQAEDRFGLFNS